MYLNTGYLLQEGKYRIEKVIGQSSFNIIYLATVQNQKGKVIIKEFFLKDCNDKSLIDYCKRKFIREAALLQKLEHKHIVKCIDVFDENNTSYYVTEFANGVRLRDYLEQSTRFDLTLRISEYRSIHIIKLIAEALDHLHKRGICHLDVKPTNIIYNHVHNEGYDAIKVADTITLLDFACAASFNEAISENYLEYSTSPKGFTKGYAPLEQISNSGKISPATDIYALGATWYFLLTGQRPPEAIDILYNGGIDEIPNVSSKVNNAIRSAMQPRIEDRPQSISEFLALFGEKLDEPSEETSMPDFEVETETVTEPQQSLAVGTELIGPSYTYIIQKVLGQGGFGITYLASVKLKGLLGTLNSDMKVAVKEFYMRDYCMRDNRGSVSFSDSSKGSMSRKYAKKFVKEALHLSKLEHQNIVKVAESFEYNNTSYYVMEYLDGKCLDDYVTENIGLSEYESIKFIRQIGAALSYMHSQEMLHMDVKPKNVMLKDGRCVLIDFGLAKQYDEQGQPESSTGLGAGTAGYAPLEQMNYSGDKEFAPTIDVYALGATLYKMLTSKTPPPASVILNDGFDRSELETINVSSDTIDIITMAMEPMKKKRIQTVDEFLTLLPGEETVRSRKETNRNHEPEDTTVKDTWRNEHLRDIEEINGIPIRWHVRASEYQKKIIRGLLSRMTRLHDGRYCLLDTFVSFEEDMTLVPGGTLPLQSTVDAYRTKEQIIQFLGELNTLTQNGHFTLMDVRHFYNDDYTFAGEENDILMSKTEVSYSDLLFYGNDLELLKVSGYKSSLLYDATKDKFNRLKFKIMINSASFGFMYKNP